MSVTQIVDGHGPMHQLLKASLLRHYFMRAELLTQQASTS